MSGRDPLGKRALFETPAVVPDDPVDHDPLVGGDHPEGRAALYSTGPHRPGSVVLECSRCGVHTRMSALEAGVRIAMISLWIPGRHFSRWMLCPECERRTWSRIHWLG